MPIQVSHATTFRKGGYIGRAYLSVFNPAPVASGTLTATPLTGATALAVTYTVGSASDVRAGFLLRFYDTATGNFKGEWRVRYSGTISSTNLPVKELPYGSIKLVSGDTFKVYPQVPPDTKLIEATSSFNPDGEPFSDEGEFPPPIVTSGGHWAGWVDPATSYALVYGNGSNSRLVAPASSGGVGHLWDKAISGAGISYHAGSANTDADPVFEVTAGQYCIEHRGEDNDTTRLSWQYISVMAHDPAVNPPYHALLPTPPVGDQLGGWSWTVELFENATLTDIPDGSLCILWVDEYIAGVKQSFRATNPGRSHIIGIGYARRDTSTGSAQEGNRVTFEIQSPLARISEIAGYSKVFEESPTPDSWSKGKTIGVLRGIEQIWLFYLTLMQAGYDFIVNPLYSDARYPAFYVNRSDSIAQIRELAGGRRAVFANNERGAQFELFPHLAFLSMTERSSVPVSYIFIDDDVIDYSYSRDHQDAIEIFELQGITGGASGNSAVFSRSPGLSPGGGKSYATEGKYIPDSQTSQNADAAMKMAYAQQIFIDSTHANRKHRVGELTLTLPGQYDFLDWNCEYVQFVYTGNRRGITFADYRYWLKRSQTSVDSDTGEWTSQKVFQAETGAPTNGASSYFPDNTVTTPVPPPSFPTFPPTTLPTPFGGLIRRGIQSMAVIGVNKIAYTGDFPTPAVAGGPDYIAPYSKPWGGTLLEWCPDGFAPGLGWILTTTQLGYVTLSDNSYVVKHTFVATSSSRSLDASFAENGFMAVVSFYPGGGGTKVLHTVDNSSFTETTVHSYDAVGSSASGIVISSKTSGRIVVGVQTSSTTVAAYISNDHGATWAAISPAFTSNYSGYWHIHAPWNNNPSDNIYYYSIGDATENIKVYRQIGATITDVTPTISANPYTVIVQRNGIASAVSNRQRMILVGERGPGSFADVAAFLSNSAGDSWSVIEQNTNLRRGALSGDDPNVGWLFGVSNLIEQIVISGSTVTRDDRSGNLASLSVGEIIAIAGV